MAYMLVNSLQHSKIMLQFQVEIFALSGGYYPGYCDVKKTLTLIKYLYVVDIFLQQPYEISIIVLTSQMKQMRHRAS